MELTGKHPLEILPEEVWKIILMNVDNPQAIRNSMKTCTSWEHWLESKRTLVHFRDVLPFVMKFLPKKDFLKCRLVCQTWKNDLDLVYQNHPSNFEPGGIYFPGQMALGRARMARIVDRSRMVCGGLNPYWRWFRGPGNTFISNNELEEFMEAMESHPGNPFPGRYIALNQNERSNYYWDNALPLLDRFGEHIWFASIIFKNCTQERLRNCLLRLPNLKMLEIRNATDYDCHCDKVKKWSQTGSINPLPPLENLESFVAAFLSRFVVDAVLKACTPENLKRIYLKAEWVHHPCIHDDVHNFPNLEVFHGNVYAQDFDKFRAAAPPLKKIDIVFRNKKKKKVPFERFFRSLEQFAGTLVDASLDFLYDDGLIDSPPVSFRVNLPKVERLNIRGYRGALDPLLQLSALKYLDVEFEDTMAEGSVLWEQLVNGKGSSIANDIPKSPIWRLMPSLQKLRLDGKDPTYSCYSLEGKYNRLNSLEGELEI